jgi:menaquinone-dependent protoporphyrinogen oxidase
VWLFSSGPIGDPPKPLENPAEVAAVVKRIGARGHRLFGGKIDGSELRVAEKALIALVRAEQGDFRPWSEISDWAESIAESLQEPPTP